MYVYIYIYINMYLYIFRSVAAQTLPGTLDSTALDAQIFVLSANSMMIFSGFCAASMRTDNVDSSTKERFITSRAVTPKSYPRRIQGVFGGFSTLHRCVQHATTVVIHDLGLGVHRQRRLLDQITIHHIPRGYSRTLSSAYPGCFWRIQHVTSVCPARHDCCLSLSWPRCARTMSTPRPVPRGCSRILSYSRILSHFPRCYLRIVSVHSRIVSCAALMRTDNVDPSTKERFITSRAISQLQEVESGE